MFIAPFLSRLINAMSKKEHLGFIGAIFILSYVSTRFDIKAIMSLNYGSCLLWFIMLFMVGAYFKKYSFKINKAIPLIIYLLTVSLQILFKYEFRDTTQFIFKLIYNDTAYNQPLTLLASICLLLLFVGIESKDTGLHKAIIYTGNCTFGIYLFHDAPIVRSVIYSQVFYTQNYWGTSYAALLVIAFALIVFTGGLILESIRRLLFFLIKKAVSFIRKEALEK